MDFEKTSKQIRALDKPEKLKILALLAEEGRKSISAVARELNIHFSTTHKYLEQLEAVGLVHSKTVKEDRLKRYFYIKDFDINLSPASLTATTHSEKQIKTFKVFTNEGVVKNFDRQALIRPYIQKGLPLNIIGTVVDSVSRNAYDYITTTELDSMVKTKLAEHAYNIRASASTTLFESTYHTRLKHTNRELLDMHRSGDIFIKNLGAPRIGKYAHDIRSILIHGVAGKIPETTGEILSQTIVGIDLMSALHTTTHLLDSFNYFIAPVSKDDADLEYTITAFIKKLSERSERFIISLDVGLPRYAEVISPSYFHIQHDKKGTYQDYPIIADRICKLVIKAVEKQNSNNIQLVFKLWAGALPETTLKSYYIANMKNQWQGTSASYIGSTRLDSNWRGWIRTLRAGEIQATAINTLRIAARSKGNVDAFISDLESAMSKIIRGYSIMDELSRGFLLAKKTVLPSVQRNKWTYVPIEHCLYSISLAELADAVKLLTKKSLSESLPVAEKILTRCNLFLQKYENMPLRLTLKEEHSADILKRFCILDKSLRPKPAVLERPSSYRKSKIFGTSQNATRFDTQGEPGYADAVFQSLDDKKALAYLHKYLLGGHKVRVNKDELKNMIDADFGLLLVTSDQTHD